VNFYCQMSFQKYLGLSFSARSLCETRQKVFVVAVPLKRNHGRVVPAETFRLSGPAAYSYMHELRAIGYEPSFRQVKPLLIGRRLAKVLS